MSGLTAYYGSKHAHLSEKRTALTKSKYFQLLRCSDTGIPLFGILPEPLYNSLMPKPKVRKREMKNSEGSDCNRKKHENSLWLNWLALW